MTNAEGSDAPANTVKDEHDLSVLVDQLSSASRKDRQNSAHTISQIAQENPEKLVPFADQLVDAIRRPEAQTRWEILDALSSVCAISPDIAERAVEGAEEALYDEESGMLRETAFRFFTRLAATSRMNAAQYWPLLDEALQCFHGDPEYLGLLDSVTWLVENADLDSKTRSSIAARMKFDAESGKGRIRTFSKRIYDLTKQDKEE
jgi:hypothetical protein